MAANLLQSVTDGYAYGHSKKLRFTAGQIAYPMISVSTIVVFRHGKALLAQCVNLTRKGKRKMKIICYECESELEIIGLHDDGSEILVKPCKSCLDDATSNAYDTGFDAGLEEDYQEGYNEAEAYYQEKIDILNEEIAELKKELDNE